MSEDEKIGVLCAVDGCDERIVGLEDGWDLGRGTTCQDCIDYHDRHGHWPDESVEICAECRIDDGMVPHDCEECFADQVLVEPGSECDNCGFEAPVTDGGTDHYADGTERIGQECSLTSISAQDMTIRNTTNSSPSASTGLNISDSIRASVINLVSGGEWA